MLILGWLGGLQTLKVVALAASINTLWVVWGGRAFVAAIRELPMRWPKNLLEFLRLGWVTASLALTLLIWLWILWWGVLLPPSDWDGLAQHLPIASQHIQSGNLTRIETPYRGIHAYPAGGSLLMAWMMLVARNDQLVDLVQWPFWLLGTLAVYHLSRCCGARRAHAMLGSLVFSLAPIVILQARSDYVDLILAGLVLSALAVIIDTRLPLKVVVLTVGCVTGVIIGLKYAGLIYALLLSGLMFWRCWDERPSRRSMVYYGVVWSGLIVTLGGFWYWRNGWDLQNPIWPMSIQLGSWTLFAGVWTTASFYQDALPSALAGLSYPQQLWTVWREATLLFTPDMRLGGLGPLWFAVGLPCLIIWGAQALMRRQRWPLRLMSFALVAFALTPANWHTRYIIISAAISSLAVAFVLDQLGYTARFITSGLIFFLGLYGVGLAVLSGPVTPNDVKRFELLPAAERRPVFMDQSVASQAAMRWFDRNIPRDAIIAYGWNGVVLYPFQGLRAQRTALYVPPAPSPNWYLALREKKVAFLIIKPGSVEAQSAITDPRFRRLYSDPNYIIYALEP